MGSNNRLVCRWEDAMRYMDIIARQMRAQIFNPALIVAIANGGIIPAGLLCQAFPGASFISVRVKGYKQGIVGEKLPGGPSIFPDDIQTLITLDSPNVLVVDDIADTGATFKLVSDYMPRAKYAAMYAKPQAAPDVNYIGHYCAQDKWVNMPWEIYA